MLEEQGYLDDAIGAYQQALALLPNNPIILNNAGNAFQKAGKLTQALTTLKQAIANNPNNAHAYNNLGNVYTAQKDFTLAKQAFENALRINPTLSTSWYNLAGLQKTQHLYQEAITSLNQALEITPSFVEAHRMLSFLYKTQKKLTKSIEHLEYCLSLSTDDLESASNLYQLYCQAFDFDNAEKMGKHILRQIRSSSSKPSTTLAIPFSLLSYTMDKAIHLSVAQKFSQKITNSISSDVKKFSPTHQQTHSRLRIGYLSSDFRNHPLTHLILGVLQHHDTDRFEIFCYSHGPDDNSHYRQAVINSVEHFIDISALSDYQAAKKINADEIDLLIDLNGHTNAARHAICAYRPAPLQATYLGFPGTSGAEFYDYMITDAIVTSLLHEQYYSEKFLIMPNTYQATNDQQAISEQPYQREDFSLPENAFVFCSFNQIFKINRQTFNLWMRILSKVENSVLWLIEENSDVCNAICSYAEEQGIDAERIIFSHKIKSKAKHLKRLALADLTLDTLIYNGHTTTSDSLWAGVPVLTLQGEHFASRVSASLLLAANLPELVTNQLSEYEELAINLGNAPDRHKALKHKITDNKNNVNLFNTAQFSQQLESLYTLANKKHQNGQKPAHIVLNTT